MVKAAGSTRSLNAEILERLQASFYPPDEAFHLVEKRLVRAPSELESLKRRVESLEKRQASIKFDDLADRTKSDYVKIIKTIELEFGDFPLVALADRGARGLFMEWRDKLAKLVP